MRKEPKIYTVPLTSTGSHETIVIVIDGVPQSVSTWNFTEDAEGNRKFFIEGVSSWQLVIPAGSSVQVIR